MNIKKRLLISNAAIFVIPIGVTLAAFFLFFIVFSQILHWDVDYNSVKKLAEIQYDFFKADGSSFSNNPDILTDKQFQEYISSRLDEFNADLVALKGMTVLYSTKNLSMIDIEKCLHNAGSSLMNSYVKIGNKEYAVKVIPVTFKNSEKGNIILLALADNGEKTAKMLLLILPIVLVLAFLITNIIFSYSISKSIIKPLTALRRAAGEISKGNLEFEVIESGDTEIKELCQAFEKMRVKLKDSLHTQIKYDENRKLLLSSISHDLKTPITSIKGYIEGILDGIANTPEKSERYLRTVLSNTVQVDRMIDDLLLYSKLDLNKIPFNFEATDIIKYFNDCIYEVQPEFLKTNIEINLKNNLKNSPKVLVDRQKLKRVILNILDNSRKYMDKQQGVIEIILRETISSIIIEIKDNGCGIAPQDLPYIFDRFYRADDARNIDNGSGLGLAIAKQIIEGHRGSIWAISHKDQGTSIMISLEKQKF